MRKHKLTSYLLSFFIVSGGIVSCADNKNALSRDKMVGILHDIQLAEIIHQTKYNDFATIEQKNALIQSVLEKHGITQAELDSSLVWYADNAEIYMRVNDSVISSLKKNLDFLKESLPQTSRESNINNSILPSYSYLSGDVPTLSFDIDSIQVKNYPQFLLEFNTQGIQEQMKAELEVFFEYKDTTITKRQPLTRDDRFKVTGDTLPLKSISGYIHLDARKAVNNKVLLYNIVLKNTEEAKNNIASNKADSLAVK